MVKLGRDLMIATFVFQPKKVANRKGKWDPGYFQANIYGCFQK